MVDALRKALKVPQVRHSLLPMRPFGELDPSTGEYDASTELNRGLANEFICAASFAATATGTHKCTFTCEKGACGKTGCRLCRPAGHGQDLHERTRV